MTSFRGGGIFLTNVTNDDEYRNYKILCMLFQNGLLKKNSRNSELSLSYNTCMFYFLNCLPAVFCFVFQSVEKCGSRKLKTQILW